MINREQITARFKELQNAICQALESEDGKSMFQEDQWTRDEGGGGITRVIVNGELIEKGGVNFSAVHGPTPARLMKEFATDSTEFYATGVSIVLHPRNPNVPIIHMNIRYFEMNNGIWWFGGGIDLTPHYVDLDEAQYFHQSLKKVCDRHHESFYGKFKKWADDYFYIRHRNETRGIGGIFFDRLNAQGSKDALFNFVMDVGNAFVPIYTSISKKKRNIEYSQRQRDWQLARRGRYVEFNLVLDRGTRFGLETKGRIESILMSLPPLAVWEYNQSPEAGTPEYDTLQYLKKNIDWINTSAT
jgi:coproporphyrinogen III oxidase